MKVYTFKPGDVEGGSGSVSVTSAASEADNKDFDLYFDYLKQTYNADTFKTLLSAQFTGTVTVEDFAITEEKIALGKVSVMSYTVKLDGKFLLSQKIYDVFANGYTTEFTVTDNGVATTPDVYEVAAYMMDSLTFGK
ncbi:MAG: hypothetical protein ACERKN_04260 [Velocimicrobium sp.]